MARDRRTRIHINEVLSTLSESDGKAHQISWVRATGRKRGSIKTVGRVWRAVPKLDKPKKRGRKPRALHADRHTIPLVDADTGQPLTPLVSHIIEFDLKKVIH